MGGGASEFAFLYDRIPSSDDEVRREKTSTFTSQTSRRTCRISNLCPHGEALAKCKFVDGNGALYVRAVDAYASSLE